MLKTKLLIFVVLSFCLASSNALAGRVAIVKSRSLVSYNKAITSFTINSNYEIEQFDLHKDLTKGRKIISEIAKSPPDLVLAVGPLAASLAAEILKDAPIVFCMVPNPAMAELKGDNITGISLSLPIKTQLKTLKIMAENVRRVGLVFNREATRITIEKAAKIAKKLGLELVSEYVEHRNQVSEALAKLQGRIDALWIIPDNVVFNPTAHAAMVDFALRSQIPFFSLTPKMVKAGALVSLSADYEAIGRQAADISKRIVGDGVSPGLIPVSPPKGLEIAMNLETAELIGVECGIALKVFTFAATKGFPIKVYK